MWGIPTRWTCGLRRTPYVLAGLALCSFGVAAAPHAVFLMDRSFLPGLFAAALVFLLYGIGFNISTVSYFALAAEVSGEQGRGRTMAVMFAMMISGIIVTALFVGQLVEPYSPAAVNVAFAYVGLAAFVLGTLAILGLERRDTAQSVPAEERHTWLVLARAMGENPQVRLFFVYLIVLLIALLGQDILLEPYGGQVFDLSVRQTTRISSLWGVFVLVSLPVAALLEGCFSRRALAAAGGLTALAGFGGIIGGGLVGSLSSGAVYDVATSVTQNPLVGYVTAFGMLAVCMIVSLMLLRRIDVTAFRRRADEEHSVLERAALAGE